MQYDAFVTRDRDTFVIDFPDCLGCQTFAESSDEVLSMAREALEGWLEAHLSERRVPPRPARREVAPKGATLLRVTTGLRLAASLGVRWARQDRDLSQKELAQLIGVSQQQVAKLEDPDANPGIDTIQKVAEALGLDVRLSLAPRPVFAPRAR